MAHSSTEQMRAWQGPALFSFGFRPFFLFGAAWAVMAMLLWVFALSGALDLPTRFDPVSWHAHEFLFGYLGAVLAGFLLTAVPNWTGRLPIVGWRLAALFALWLAGRLAVLGSAGLPHGLAVVIDIAFPLILAGVILREIIASKNWRNLIILALLSVFTIANVIFHIEASNGDSAAQGTGLRLGVATAVMMIAVVGGRIIPSFTRTWLARSDNSARPAPPMQRFDKTVLLVSLAVLMLWVAHPFAFHTALALIVFSLLHLARQWRWQGHHTRAEPLVWVLHVSYGFIALGAAVIGFTSLIGAQEYAAAQHIWMVGAIGAMTLAVMTRATLGHTGQPLSANRATLIIYLCLFGAVAARMGASFLPLLTHFSGFLWLSAFGGFLWVYGPLLAQSQKEKKL